MDSVFSRFDVFPKYRDDVKVRTLVGATISLASMIIMGLLLLSEFYDYMSVQIEEHLVIDSSNLEFLPINFDIAFHRIPCSLVSLDVFDVSGNQAQVDHQSITKQVLDLNGRAIGSPIETNMGGVVKESEVLAAAQQQSDGTQEHSHSHYRRLLADNLDAPNEGDIIDNEQNADTRMKAPPRLLRQERVRNMDAIDTDADDSDTDKDFDTDTDSDSEEVEATETPDAIDNAQSDLNEKAAEIGEANDNDCGSCYGGESADLPCCRTCEDVQMAYHRKGWSIPRLADFEQCQKEGVNYEAERKEMSASHGCRVTGYIETKRGQGNFHFAPGHTFSDAHTHMHDFGAFAAGSFDTSHTIYSFNFGINKDDTVFRKRSSIREHSPLDDSKHQSAFDGRSVFQYYAKVIPIRATKLDGSERESNDFSVTKHETELKMRQGYGLPGVFFFYEFSPLMLEIKETTKPFSHFLTQVCAILGGVYTITALIDKLVHGTLKSMQKKKELGKFG